MSLSNKCVVEPFKHDDSEGASDASTDVKKALKLLVIPGLKDLAVGSDWKGCLELMKKQLGFQSDEYQQLLFAIEYEEVLDKIVEKGFIDFIKLLLHNGFPVNTAVGCNSRTMLHLAIKYNKINMMNLLLSYGADINLTDSQGFSAIHLVAQYGSYDIAKLLLQNSDESSILCKGVNARDASGNSALHLACREGHYNIVCLLLERQVNMKTRDVEDVDARTEKGYTALHLAAENGHANIVRLFLQREVNINVRTDNGETPFILAAKEGHIEVMKTLLSNSYCDVDATDTRGYSSLHLAAENGHNNIVCHLLNGVNINSRTRRSETPLILAARNGCAEVLETLLSSFYCDVDVTETRGYSALHYAAQYGYSNIVCRLLKEKVNINARTNERETPLILAAKNGNTETARILLSNVYCNVDARDKLHHRTALEWAEKKYFQSVVELLTSTHTNI